MKREKKPVFSMMLVFALVLSIFASVPVPANAASGKVKVSKKNLTVKVGQTKTIKVKNTNKKVKWSVKTGRVTLVNKTKTSVGIKGKKAGRDIVYAKVGSKKLSCIVKVKKADKKKDETSSNTTPSPVVPTQTPVSTQTPVPTQTPSPVPTQTPSPVPTQTPEAADDAVKNIVIDMSKAGSTVFTMSPATLNFSSQLDDRFDLSYFSEMKVGYKLEFDGDTSLLSSGKIGIADSEAALNGYDDGVAFTYDMMPGSDSVTIPLDKSGNAIGINIQPMDKDASYGWPATLKSVTITSIEFVAKEGAVYPSSGAVKPTQKPADTQGFTSSEFKYQGLDEKWIKENIDPSKPVVAMTFDDGPGGYTGYADYGTQIQNALKEAGAHATFFYIGAHIEHDEKSRQEVENAWKAGFEVANHSYDSQGLDSKDEATIKDKIAKTDALLSSITGYNNFLFRAPNVAYSDKMFAVIEKPFIDVSIWSSDWDNSVGENAIVDNVVKNLADGGIINMHSVHEKTAKAVPRILKYCKEKGYQVVSVSELFAIKGQKLMTGVKYSKAGAK